MALREISCSTVFFGLDLSESGMTATHFIECDL
nr:MAG TPA: hypothetical protein [Caudoviricetes sp.]